ncbi:hypothetical protein JCM8097_008862 [Rhodosporidiobolus ruineniae]
MATVQPLKPDLLDMLPVELLDAILKEAFPRSSETDGGNTFHRIRDGGEEKALANWATSAGRSSYSFVRSLIFYAPYVGTRSRADRLSLALRLAFPDNPSSAGYLVPLVKRLSLDIRERELPRDQDPFGRHKKTNGITPLQISELAQLLPNLITLDVLVTDVPGWASDPKLIEALTRFKRLRHLEFCAGGLGWKHVLATCLKLDDLETLKVQGCMPDWTFLSQFSAASVPFTLAVHNTSAPYSFGKSLTTLVLWECALAENEFTSLFTSLAPGALLPPTSQPVGGASAFPPPILRHLTLHHLRTLPDSVHPIPFPPTLLISHLSPLIPHLHSLHLVLFDRPALTNNQQRTALALSGQLQQGHLSGQPDDGHRPGNALAALLGPDFTALTLGGPLCGGRVRRLTLRQCADIGRVPGGGDGVSAQGCTAALDREWASRLEELDVSGMEDLKLGAAEEAAWGEEALEALKGKVEALNQRRKRLGEAEMDLKVDEEVVQRANDERAFREKREARKRQRSKSSRGGKAVTTQADRDRGVSGEKRRKTVG